MFNRKKNNKIIDRLKDSPDVIGGSYLQRITPKKRMAYQ